MAESITQTNARRYIWEEGDLDILSENESQEAIEKDNKVKRKRIEAEAKEKPV